MKAVSYKKLLNALMLAALVLPAVAFASTEQPFGGKQVMIFDEGICDCSETNVHFIMDDATDTELSLYYDEGKLYDHDNIDNLGEDQKGTYSPGAEPCMMEVGPDCVEVTTPDGTYGNEPGTGTAMIKTTQEFASGLKHFVDTLSYGKA